MIEFHLDERSGVPPYLQIVQQVQQALRLGMLGVGDRLPTVREVVEQLVINPNTVLKAYRELEHQGLVSSRPGQGTFSTVVASIHDVIEESHTNRQTTLLVRINRHLVDASWEVQNVMLEEVVLAYMCQSMRYQQVEALPALEESGDDIRKEIQR